jgi:hypothetical protein
MASSSANSYNHRRGETRPRMCAVDSAIVIMVGDMLWMNTDDVRPLDQFTWDTSITVTNRKLRTRFAGMALDASASGETDEIRVGTAGIYEFTCAAGTFEVGDLLGLVKQSGNYVENRKVVKVTDPALAIARVYERYASNTTVVKGEIFPPASGNGGGIPQVKRFTSANPANLAASAATKFVDGVKFANRIKIVRLWGIVTTAVVGTTTAPAVKITTATNDIDDTLTFPNGTGAGVYLEADVSDANGYDYVEAGVEIEFAIAVQAVGSAAGGAICGFDYYEVGAAA